VLDLFFSPCALESLKLNQDLVNKTDLALNSIVNQKKTGSFESLYANISNAGSPVNAAMTTAAGKPGTVDQMLEAHRRKKQQQVILDENMEALSQTTKKLIQEQDVKASANVQDPHDESLAPSEDGEEVDSTMNPQPINSIPHSIIIPTQAESQTPSTIMNPTNVTQPSKGILRSTIFEKMLETKNCNILSLAQAGNIQKLTEEDVLLPQNAKEVIQARLMQHSASVGRLKQVLLPVLFRSLHLDFVDLSTS
jgi:hypothetical protein